MKLAGWEKILVDVYKAGKLPLKVEYYGKSSYHRYYYYDLNWKLLSDLIKKDLVKVVSDKSFHCRTYYALLTEEGEVEATGIFKELFKSVSSSYEEIVSKYSPKLIRTIVLGARREDDRIHIPLVEYYYDFKYSSIDELSTLLGKVEEEIFSKIFPKSRESLRESNDRSGIRLIVGRREDILNSIVYSKECVNILLSRLLLLTSKKIFKKAVSLGEELESIGLSIMIPVLNSVGEYCWRSFVIPPLITTSLISLTDKVDMRYELFRLGEILIILKAYRYGIKMENLERICKVSGIPLKLVEYSIEILSIQGVTSEFNKSTSPKSPAFHVKDKYRAHEIVEEAFKCIEEEIINRVRGD